MYIVTGMHRSGTSFTSQVLHSLGADFGDPELLFPADKWNQNGYFENIDVIDVNNRMILGDGAHIRYWLEAPENRFIRALNSLRSRKWKYSLFPPQDKIEARAERYSDRLESLHTTYQTKYVKDPRFCLTIGAWSNIGEVEGLVFSFRNPFSVAGSVKRREGLPTAYGYRYWLYHVRGFVRRAPRSVPLFLVDFDAFFDAEAQRPAFHRIARHLGLENDDPRVTALPEVLDVRLRTQTERATGMPRDIEAAYRALQDIYTETAGETFTLDAFPRQCQAILG